LEKFWRLSLWRLGGRPGFRGGQPTGEEACDVLQVFNHMHRGNVPGRLVGDWFEI
jgi:hypothetical protein